MKALPLPEIGDVLQAPYHFVRSTYTAFDESGTSEVKTWKPGIKYEPVGYDESEAFADGVGLIKLTVIGIYKPGRFPTRIFFTRKWVDPDGHEFGKDKLRVTTASAFRMLARGYRYQWQVYEP